MKRRPKGARVAGDVRGSVREPGREVRELDFGILVYPPTVEGDPWRAVLQENGKRRFRESGTETGLAAKLEKVTERLAADAPNMTRPGSDLIHWYLNPDRLPVARRWSRRHADTQTRLCKRFARPVIDAVTCQDITLRHMQDIVNAAPTAGEGDRVHRMLSALVGAGIHAGYLTSPRLAEVHWHAGDRPLPEQQATVAGESVQWVDPAEIPATSDVPAAWGRP